jgi:hypothetical protein
MKITISHSHTFTKLSKRFSKKYKSFDSDLEDFSNTIHEQNPDDLGDSIFKYRIAIKSKNKGKSGGLRIITLEVIVCKEEKNITFLTIYDKSEQSSISKKDITDLLQ